MRERMGWKRERGRTGKRRGGKGGEGGREEEMREGVSLKDGLERTGIQGSAPSLESIDH